MQHGSQRQIDYILVDAKYCLLIIDARLEKALELRSDHRAVEVLLNISGFAVRPKRKRKCGSTNVGWAPAEITKYHHLIDGRISEMKRTI